MTTIPLADPKARLSAVLDEVRDTHERVVITRNGRPEAVLMAVSDLAGLEETIDLLSTPGAGGQIPQAEADIAARQGLDAAELGPPAAGAVAGGRAARKGRAFPGPPGRGRPGGRRPGGRGWACHWLWPPPWAGSLSDRSYSGRTSSASHWRASWRITTRLGG